MKLVTGDFRLCVAIAKTVFFTEDGFRVIVLIYQTVTQLCKVVPEFQNASTSFKVR